MGLLARISTVFKSKINKVVNEMENPQETLDYSYEKQLELLQNVRRNITNVVTAKKRLELQTVKLRNDLSKIDNQTKEALRQEREDLARLSLERKMHLEQQIQDLEQQVSGLNQEQEKLVQVENRLRAKVDSFRTKKEVIKAQYSASEAQVKIGEAMSGLSEEMADVGTAIERAEHKTQEMQARASAIDELIASGTLEDPLGNQDSVETELRRLQTESRLEDELARLKKEVTE
ncbi:MAG: PspA/IM30 family protein [Syntrophaceticus sp.]|jgi:phage shock protein A|nr:PspA/IM30 family protein [Syntrophaceticus sp.]MDD3314840.1 PspA/IM30 family protein [Syntrophaceticus sp.]MDD4359981.1 PspA/IM30 family protein [Syntrophaceticus sp.]MDD4783241.1 PspA/IM30 family protein [Syntrophaceticus sp.]